MPFPEEPTPPPVHERAAHPALRGFQEPVRAWFAGSFQSPTRAQELAWPVIQSGRDALILAPTGSGKTLAAFLSAHAEQAGRAEGDHRHGPQVGTDLLPSGDHQNLV